jgi:triosephosphate isomerase
MSPNRRRPLVGGNWKMHFLREDATNFCGAFLAGGALPADVVLFPSFPLLPTVAEALEGTDVGCGGQDLHPEDKGAHTGDVSGPQLVDAGCSWVLCGHSERRQDHGESDDLVRQKALAALRYGLTPLICVGETQAERQAERTFEVLERQLRAALTEGPATFTLAYEPVWAIGTGETATPEIAQEAHRFLRDRLTEMLGETAAQAKRILYGGSVNPQNADELISKPDLDGFLVGGASLDPEKFLAIIRSCGSDS